MSQRLSEVFVRGKTVQEGRGVPEWLSVALSVVAGLLTLETALASRDILDPAAWAICFVVLGVVAVLSLRRPRRLPIKGTTIFTPFESDPASRWKRKSEIKRLMDFLDGSWPLAIVVGASGSGKTVLLRTLLHNALEEAACADLYYDEYPIEDGRLEREIKKEANAGKSLVVILDQFEQLLAWMLRAAIPVPEEESARLLNVIDEYAGRDVKFVVSIRQEWFHELRWLGGRMPPLSECIDVDPPRAEEIGNSVRRAFGRLGRGVTAAEIVTELERGHAGRLWPLEAQIVGAALERIGETRSAAPDIRLLRSLGGVPGAINAYFDTILDAAQSRRVALKVLCALSAQTRFRERIEKDKVVDVLFERTEDVAEAIEFLHSQKLLVRRGTDSYELSHDYVAEIFHQKGSWELDPIEHDNILFHVEELAQSVGAHDSRALKLGVKPTAERARGWLGFATILLVPLAVMMLVRLFTPRIDFAIAWGGPVARPVAGDLIDETYLPVFIAHLPWATYVGLFYHRVFRHLTVGLLWSRATVIGVVICAVAAMVLPGVWVLSIAVCGLLVGLTMARLSFVPLNEIARKRLRITGAITAANMIFLGLLGGTGLAMSVAYVHSGSRLTDWIAASAVLAAAMACAAFALIPAHVSRRAAAQTLGLLARPTSPVVPRMGASYLPGEIG